MSEVDPLITKFDFVLPRGLVDESGQVHRQGVMRPATARDEIVVDKDPRGRGAPTYRTLLMLSQVITQLGVLTRVMPEQLENLFTKDLAYLREFYNRINQQGDALIATQCPQCNHGFDVELRLSGESSATP
ncbi:MAG: phage tail assembly protein [Leptolyngbyaceae cyanobacterium MO_188.B28]|nr:phage tail assembly protein [Leptolyngbyaceae cyanobacterium MO_188.B28]